MFEHSVISIVKRNVDYYVVVYLCVQRIESSSNSFFLDRHIFMKIYYQIQCKQN